MRLMCIFVHMIDNIKAHLKDVAAFAATTADEVEQFRIGYLGKGSNDVHQIAGVVGEH